MKTGDQSHWDAVYRARDEEALTWFEAAPATSLALIRRYLAPGAALIDVGGGASRLVDALVADGAAAVTVLDLSPEALKASRDRLGARAENVDWIAADITSWSPDRTCALWHDRAVFHFLTDPADRAAYVRALRAALAPGGVAIVSTFADDGPDMCSGLPVARYSPTELASEFDRHAPGVFTPLEARRHMHITPKGNRQSFQYSVFRKAGATG